VGEIDVSSELAQKAKALLEAKVALQALLTDETNDHFIKQRPG
jgi:hypothetical protein